MKSMMYATISLLGALGLLAGRISMPQEVSGHHREEMAASDSIPGDSIYQLPVTLLTAENQILHLADLRGRPLLITMFYSHCTSVCPLLTSRLQRSVDQLSPVDRQQVRILMVSFDAARDTPEVLAAFKAEHHIEGPNWIIAHASASDVRALAAALGIRYRQLPDHSFNHSALISVTDSEGIVRARTSDLTATDDAFIREVHDQVVASERP
jgi:protein SCO1